MKVTGKNQEQSDTNNCNYVKKKLKWLKYIERKC